MATRAFIQVLSKHWDLVVAELSKVPEFKDKPVAKALQVLRMFALLHDVGHTAFSHVPESLIPGGKHEPVSVHVVKEHVGKRLNELFFEGCADLVARLIEHAPELIFLRQFVIGEIDMDRTDYLLRDSLHCGVDYGKFDFRQLLESLTVFRNQDTGRLELAIERGGEHIFEALILARYQMNTQVYYHKVRRIYDHYIVDYMSKLLSGCYPDFAAVLTHNDMKLLMQMEVDCAGDSDRKALAERILYRRHHREVFRRGDTADTFQLKTAKRVFKKLQEEYAETDFYLDVGEGSIHKLAVPGQHEESKVDDFFLIEKDGTRKLLTQESAVLNKIPKNFRVVRIYADATPEKLLEISAAANREAARGT